VNWDKELPTDSIFVKIPDKFDEGTLEFYLPHDIEKLSN
jgi:hypothetical protein